MPNIINQVVSFLLMWYSISRGDLFGVALVSLGFLFFMALLEEY